MRKEKYKIQVGDKLYEASKSYHKVFKTAVLGESATGSDLLVRLVHVRTVHNTGTHVQSITGDGVKGKSCLVQG